MAINIKLTVLWSRYFVITEINISKELHFWQYKISLVDRQNIYNDGMVARTALINDSELLLFKIFLTMWIVSLTMVNRGVNMWLLHIFGEEGGQSSSLNESHADLILFVWHHTFPAFFSGKW